MRPSPARQDHTQRGSTRRQWLTAAGTVPLFQRPAWPNIVVILADDLGHGDLSSYGARDIRTPNIDRLMASGVRFDYAYSNSPVCSPTRAALLSGCYPDRAGVPGVIRTHPENSWGRLSPRVTLLAEPLKAAGYHTAIIGKWHLGLEAPDTPRDRGFDYFHGFLGDMMDDYFNHRRHGNNYMRRNGETIDPQGHATDLFTGWAVDYVNSRRGRSDPFFLYLPYNAPHTPVQPPDDWLAKVKQREPGLPDKRAKLAALVEHMDAGVGRVMDALRTNGQLENTLVIFTSDNGGQLDAGGTAGALRGGKQDMYEGGIRVPFGAAWQGRIPAAARSRSPVMSMDIYATVCEAAGAAPPPDIDGVSLLGAMTGGASLPARDLVWVRREGGARYFGRDYYAFRRGNWKLLQNSPFSPYELYDLAADPEEKQNLAPREPQRMRELTAALALHVQRAGSVPWQRATPLPATGSSGAAGKGSER
jgi:arylsulfatase A-like enzyme